MTYSHALFAAVNNVPQVIPEVRILIDGSDVMTKEDPQNIRLSILKEIAKVLPNNTLAGVWVFGTSIKTLIPVSKIEEQWVAKIEKITKELDNQGEYKNLGEALESITAQWIEPTESPRKIVLLTDGFVNIAQDNKENDEAKAHILNSLLPQFKRNNIKLCVVSISDTADVDFLQELAIKTDGIYQKVGQAENINWLLLKIFEQSLRIDPNKLEKLPSKVVPIEEHNFAVEQAIDEINLLVFRAKTTDMLVLKTPAGKVLDKNTTSKKLRWETDKNMDFITLSNPKIGKWTIMGDLEQQNKFIAMDGLDIEVTSLPGDVFVGESFMLTACLANNGELIKNEEFLKSIKFNAVVEPDSALINPYNFNSNKDKKNNYSLQLGPFTQAFKDAITVDINFIGKTFKRNKQQKIRILPVPIKVKADVIVDKKGQQVINIEAIPDGNILDLKNINLMVSMEDDQEEKLNYDMIKRNNKWQLSLTPKANIVRYTAQINVVGETIIGRYVELAAEPVTIVVPQITLPEPVIIKVIEKAYNQENDNDINVSTVGNKTETKKPSMVKLVLFIIGFLLSAVGLLGVFVVSIRKLKKEQQNKLDEVMSKFNGE
jgi:hypothetical protein